MSNDGHVYYNMIMTNNTNYPQLAKQSDTRSDNILEDMENFHVTIPKFVVPTSNLPIIQNFPTGTGATAQATGYSITIVGTGGATASQQFLNYTPIDNTGQSYIYSYETLVNMVTTALQTAAIAAGATGANGGYPYMTFDAHAQLFSIYYPNNYGGSGSTIWFNANMYYIFPSFAYSYYNSVDYSFANLGEFAQLNKNLYPDPDQVVISNYQQLIQEYPTTTSLYAPRSLRFVTSTFSTRPEFIPSLTGTGTNTSTNNNTGNNNNVSSILTDFDLPVGSAVSDIKPFIQYYQQGQYRLLDIVGSGRLKKIDLQIFWIDATGNSYPLYIDPQQSATIKFLFIRK